MVADELDGAGIVCGNDVLVPRHVVAHLPGVHRRFTGTRPIADLYLWMLHAMGVDADTFGAVGTTPLEGMDAS